MVFVLSYTYVCQKYGNMVRFSNVDLQSHHYILSQIPDSTVVYDLCMDVATHLGYDWHYHHCLLVLLRHDILYNSFCHFLQRMEILWKEKWVEKIVVGCDTLVHRLYIL